MKKYTRKFLLLFLFVVARQASAHEFFSFQTKVYEKVVLFTDRSIYIAGEQIQFSGSIINSDESDSTRSSRILYCELITPDGKMIANNKFLVSNSIAAGCIAIPIEIVTGIYYVRAYTKLMRQNGPQFYEYRQIRIINPRRPDVLQSENNQTILAQQSTQTESKSSDDLLSVSLEKSVYTPHDTINLSYEQNFEKRGKIKSICISVVPEYSKSLASVHPVKKEPLATETGYYPETLGLSIAGKLTESSSTIPVTDKKVNLSIIGKGRDFMAVRTDDEGRFFFALPDYYGSRDLFLCAEKTPSQTLKIWVDNDFCTSPFRFPSPTFYLNEKERQMIQIMAQNVQINSHFHRDIIKDSLNAVKDTNSFYGKPTSTLYIDKYIQLPTLEEYFNELPSQVKVRKRKGEPYFAVQGSANISFYDPLVLIDWVAVDEPSKILAVSPLNISHIEVVNEDYVKGDQIYGGIISFISRKGDFAGIDLPSTGIFINYRFLDENQCHDIFYSTAVNLPDVRNTVLWEPILKVPENQPEKIIITAPDTPGKYSVVLEGITTEGEIFSVTSGFEVKN